MTKKIIVLLMLCAGLGAGAQVTINVQLPPSGLVQKDQLWNVVAVNNTAGVLEGVLTLSLQEAVSGRTVLSASSGKLVLPRGMKVLTPQDVQPVQYNFAPAGLMASYLPIGSYTACYRLSKVAGDAIEPVADECVQINISPLSPPLLNTPADRSESTTMYPQFSWIPPTPAEMFSELNYRISLAEILPGQTPGQAILNNVPIYVNQHLTSVVDNYPPSYTQLEAGKKYAWQVQAYNGNSYVTSTDVWMFAVKADTASTATSSAAYIGLTGNGESMGMHTIEGNELLIAYYSYDRAHETSVQFFDASGRLVQELQQQVSYGDNYFRFRLGHAFQKEKTYRLLITDQRGGIHQTSFSIKK